MLIKRSTGLTPKREEFFFPLETTFDELFNSFFADDWAKNTIKASTGYPRLDIGVEGDKWVVKAAVPGVAPDQVKVEITPDNVLVISGEMSQEYKSSESMQVRELHKSKFSREIYIPEIVEGDPDAKVKDGILTLTWKIKTKIEPPKAKRIEVKKV